MTVNQGRRTVLEGALATLVGAAVLGAKPAAAQSGPAAAHRRLLTITYPAGASTRFDADYYRDHHVKLFMDIYGPAIERFELRTIAAKQTGDFSVLMNIWIADFDLFRARSTPAAYQRMGDDKKNFTNASSSIQVDEVTYEAGEPRAHIPKGCGCLSLLYPAGEAGAWSNEGRCRAYAEGVTKLLGREVLRRIELRQGIEQLDDGKPTYQGGINLYARKPTTLSEAWRRNRLAVQTLSAELCKAVPVELNTTVFGIDSTHDKT